MFNKLEKYTMNKSNKYENTYWTFLWSIEKVIPISKYSQNAKASQKKPQNFHK